MSANPAVALQQVRKPYTITKQRERWTEEEHVKFVEALQLFGRGWRKIEEHIGTKTAVQIRSHAQKFFSKVERDKGSAGQHIEIPPPRPKRKPSHPYPKKAGLSSSDDTAAQCSQSCLEDNTPTQSVAKIGAKKGLKLFGATLLVDDPSFEEGSSPCREDESGVESGASDFQRTKCGSDPRLNHSEVSSRRDRDQEFDQQNLENRNLDQQSQQQSQQQSPQQSQQYQLQLSDQQLAMNNLIVLHYAAFLAAAHHPNQGGQVNPWQLLTPQQVLKPQHEILRWQSMTDSNSPGAVDNNNDDNINNVKNNNKIMNIINNIKNNDSNDDKTDTDDEVVEAVPPPPRKRRRSNPVTEEKSSSSSTTTTSVFHGDDDSSQQACSRFSSMPEYSSPRGGFVPYKRPSAAINNNKRQDRR